MVTFKNSAAFVIVSFFYRKKKKQTDGNSTLDPDSILVTTTVLDLLLLIDIFNFVSSDLIWFKPKWLSNLLVSWLCLKPLEDLATVKILYSGFRLSR